MTRSTKGREQAEREARPTAAIIDSQSVRSAEKGGLDRSAEASSFLVFGFRKRDAFPRHNGSVAVSYDHDDHAGFAHLCEACFERLP